MQRRTSGRTSRKSYTVDAFETVPELRDASRSVSPGEQRSSKDRDDAFDGEDAPESSEEDSEADVPDFSDADSVAASIEDDVVEDIVGPVKAVKNARKRHVQKPKDGSQLLTSRRGQDNVLRSGKKEVRFQFLFGPSQNDSSIALATLNRWASLPTLPSRSNSLAGRGGFHFHDADAQNVQHLYRTEWLWYFEHGGSVQIGELQRHTSCDAAPFLPPLRDSSDILVGPVESPNLIPLSPLESVPLADAWRGKDLETEKTGFILNVGARIRSLQWLPNNDKVDQILAVSVLTERHTEDAPWTAPVAPAFAKSPPYDAAIQLWSIPTTSTGKLPHLTALLCASWGDVKAFRFCPIPCNVAKDPPTLLAGIWTDGRFRVFTVPNDIFHHDELSPLQVTQAALEIEPLDTVFTCLTWISPRLIAVGTASGSIALIDLAECLQTGSTRPYKYVSVSDTYIQGIAASWPSYPHLIFTISMDGHTRMTDVSQASPSAPEANAQAVRVRAVLPAMVWSDFAQCVMVTDDNFYLRAYPIRRMYTHFASGRTRSTAISLAHSPWHPCILLGTTGGEVVATNPLVRINEPKKALHMQTWFAHEWRRPAADDKDRLDAGDRIVKNGLSRFVDGFKAEQIRFNDGDGSTRSYTPQTVYEKKTAVTAVAWCPNLVAAGWAAAGMADGLIRVEDIALPR